MEAEKTTLLAGDSQTAPPPHQKSVSGASRRKHHISPYKKRKRNLKIF